jgi:hypothetical protein
MMKTTNKIYPWRVKENASRKMASMLNYPETPARQMDGQICRITVTSLTLEANIRKAPLKELGPDRLWQIQVLGIDDREFLVLQSLLASSDDIVIVDKTDKLRYGDSKASTDGKDLG